MKLNFFKKDPLAIPSSGYYSTTKGHNKIAKTLEGPSFSKAGTKPKDDIFITPDPGAYKQQSEKGERIFKKVLCYFEEKISIDKNFYPDLLKKNSPNEISLSPKNPPNSNPFFKSSEKVVPHREFQYIDKKKLLLPGPGYYQTPIFAKPKGTSGIKFPSAKEFHDSYLRKEEGPGPGEYHTEQKKFQKGIKFKVEGLHKSQEEKKLYPGPGAYYSKPDIILNRFFQKPPAYSFSKARSQTPKKLKESTPGPLEYSPKMPYKHTSQIFLGKIANTLNNIIPKKAKLGESFIEIDIEKEMKIAGGTFKNQKILIQLEDNLKYHCKLGSGHYEPRFDELRLKNKGGAFAKSRKEIKA